MYHFSFLFWTISSEKNSKKLKFSQKKHVFFLHKKKEKLIFLQTYRFVFNWVASFCSMYVIFKAHIFYNAETYQSFIQYSHRRPLSSPKGGGGAFEGHSHLVNRLAAKGLSYSCDIYIKVYLIACKRYAIACIKTYI